jgi:hypothetical protein
MPNFTPDSPKPPDDAPRVAATRARAQSLLATLRLACTPVEAGRAIDLAGLNDQVGRLCATAMDLPPEQGFLLRDDLITLRGAADALHTALRDHPPPP